MNVFLIVDQYFRPLKWLIISIQSVNSSAISILLITVLTVNFVKIYVTEHLPQGALMGPSHLPFFQIDAFLREPSLKELSLLHASIIEPRQ